MRVAYKQHWPESVRAAVEPFVDEAVALDLLPRWLEDLWLYYDAGSAAEPAETRTTVCYCNAKLTLRAAFFEADEETRRQILVHEFHHVHTAPLRVALDDVVDEVAKTNQALAERLRTEIHRADERVVTGLEAAFDRARRQSS